MPDANGDRNPLDVLASIVQGEPNVRLQFVGNRIALEVTTSAKSAPTTLEVGSFQRLFEILVHEPATANEIEAAIAEIEDMLMPAIRALPKHGHLMTLASPFDALLQAVGRPDADTVQLEISTVEDVFGRLASVAYGTPATQLGVPESRSFAAAVLVLRELMHHAGFGSVLFEQRPTGAE